MAGSESRANAPMYLLSVGTRRQHSTYISTQTTHRASRTPANSTHTIIDNRFNLLAISAIFHQINTH